jgi:hypothetical protein
MTNLGSFYSELSKVSLLIVNFAAVTWVGKGYPGYDFWAGGGLTFGPYMFSSRGQLSRMFISLNPTNV